MLPDRVSNPGPLTYESGALPIALRGPAILSARKVFAPLWSKCFSFREVSIQLREIYESYSIFLGRIISRHLVLSFKLP